MPTSISRDFSQYHVFQHSSNASKQIFFLQKVKRFSAPALCTPTSTLKHAHSRYVSTMDIISIFNTCKHQGVVCALFAIDITLIILYSYKPTSLRPNLTVDLGMGLETYVSPVNCPNLIIVPGEERRKNNNIYVKKCPTSAVKRLSAFNHS